MRSKMIGLVVVFALMVASVVMAQSPQAPVFQSDNRYDGYPAKITTGWPSQLPNLEACRASEYYVPRDTHLLVYMNRVSLGTSRIRQTDECTFMSTSLGMRWVLRPKGTEVKRDILGRDLFDGECGNPAPVSIATMEPVRDVPQREVPPPYERSQPVPQRVPQEIAVPRNDPPPPAAEPMALPRPTMFDRTPIRHRKEGKQWGPTLGAMIGLFQSTPIGSTIESIAGREVCVEGRIFDFGIAYGGPRSSIWRVTFAAKLFNQDSLTRYPCIDCNQEVTTVAASGVRALGLKVERVIRINISDSMPIQPMISIHGGIGYMSGVAYRYLGPIEGRSISVSEVRAREMFGSDWFPVAGAGIGVMGDLGRHLTYSITVAGIEYPGVYYGQLQLTYWPRSR